MVTYTITFTDELGTASDETGSEITQAAKGTLVTITAKDRAEEGLLFTAWQAPEGLELADDTEEITTFTMPDSNVELAAEYAPLPDEGVAMQDEQVEEMIVGMLPTTALAATYNDVKVNGVSLGDGKYLASNSATDSNYSNTEPSSYVAWYKDGTLTLNGYEGTGIVLQGAPAADLIIKLIGDNTITTTTNEVGIQGNGAAGSITITADSGSNGNLTIDMTHSTRPVFGINGYANSVTITGSADVKITAVATATNRESYGIKSSKAVSILDSASVSITCKTPNSTSRSDTCNGIYSDTGVTINTGGTIQIDVSDAGDEAFSYGINSMGTLTLTKVGGMTVKWKKAGVQGSPLLPSSASFDSDAYDNIVDKTNCIATYMPKGTTPGEITTGNAKVTAPVAGQTPSFTAISDEPEKYSVKVLRWIDVENNQDITSFTLTDPASYYYNYTFEGGKEYTAVVEFTAVGDNTLSYSNSFTINGETTYWQGNGLYRFHTFTATGTGGGEGTKVYSATVADINITLPAGYTSNDIDDLGQDRTIKVTNTGTEILYISEPTLSGTNASDFSVRKFGKLVVHPGGTNTTAYAIEPKIGLAPGTYTATISCTDDDNKLSVPVTAKVTLTVSDHNWDTSKWEFNPLTHWHKCTDSGCSAKRDEAAHNSDKVVGAKNATFDTDGYTGDKYCSICDRKMKTGKAIAAGKYIRESKATMTPAGIDNTISANDLVFTSLDTSKYTVGLYRVFDMTDTTLNTVGMGYPHDKKFISGHKYAIEFEFEAVDPYVYDTMHDTHSSTFKLNDAGTMMSAATTHAGSPARRVELVAGGVSVATYDLTTSVNGGHGTISAGENGITEGTSKIITFTPDSGYEIDKVMVNGTETTVTGNTLTVTMDGNKNVVVTYKAIEYTITVTDGKATVGAGSEISKAAEGTAVTLTANAAPSGKVFDKWVVESGSVALADSNSATTTFTMPASAVSVKATYKNAPHTHTYNQETVKPEALKTPAGCTNNAVYFKSCSCGAISTTDTFVAMNTALGHADGSDWKYDSTNHWHECSRCHDKKDEAAHDYGSDNVCDTCGYDKTVPHTHNLTLVPAKAATCTNPGNSAYYTCDGCDKWFEDATGSVEITDKTSVEIAPLNHDWNAPAYTWNADNTVCTATRTCKRDAGHKETATATVTSAQTKAPTCTAKGETTYTAAFTEAWANTQTKTVDNIAALGHDWSTAWTGDSTGHWHKCTRCDATTTKAAHTASNWIIDTPATDTTAGTKRKECTVCKKVLETATIPALVKIDVAKLTVAKPVKDATAEMATTGDSTYTVVHTEWKAADDSILAIGEKFKPGTVYTVKITLKAKENNVFTADSTYNKIEGKDAKLVTAVTGNTDSVILTYTFDATEGVAYNITEGANGIWVKGSTDTLRFTADGEYAKFKSVQIDGTELATDKYTTAAGSTVITLKNDYLNTLAAGAHTIAIIYTDGDCSTQFTVHQHTYGTAWSSDDTHHWHECTDASCPDKVASMINKAEHTFVWQIDVPASQASTGTKHEECTVCGKKRNENTVIDKLPGSSSGSHHSSNNNNSNNNTGTEAAAPEAAAPAPAASAPVTTTTSARTGDSSNLIGWLAVLLISGGAAGAWYTVAKKKKEQ